MNLSQVDTLLFPEKAQVAGIGKVNLKRDKLAFNIPHLHILVVKGFSEGCFDAINLEFGLHGQGENPKFALSDSIEQIVKYFDRNKIDSKEKFKVLIQEQDNHLISDYWRVFRRTEMELALEARDLGSSMENSIREEAEKELRELKKELQKMIDKNMDLKDQIQKLYIEQAELKLVKDDEEAA